MQKLGFRHSEEQRVKAADAVTYKRVGQSSVPRLLVYYLRVGDEENYGSMEMAKYVVVVYGNRYYFGFAEIVIDLLQFRRPEVEEVYSMLLGSAEG